MLHQFSLGNRSIIRNVLFAAIAVFSIAIAIYLYKFNGQITGFFRIGDAIPLSPYLEGQKFFLHSGKVGNDGQQFLSIALDPLLQNQGTLAALDNPTYRYRRILYPLLGYILGFGSPRWIPFALVGINCLCIVLIVYVMGLILQSQHQKSWRSLFTLCIPSVWMVLSVSTADLLSGLLLVTTIFFYQTERPFYASLTLALACMTRETMLMLWLAIAIASVMDRKGKQLLYLPLAVVPIGLWNFSILQRFPLLSDNSPSVARHFSYPFVGILEKISAFSQAGLTSINLFDIYLFALLIAAFTLINLSLKHGWQHLEVVLITSWLYGALFLISKMQILGHFVDYSRVYIDIYFLLLISIIQKPNIPKEIIFFLGGLGSITYILAFALEKV
ncbi:hypothetical protein V2H45_15805 [Tumidithrix elongata RA019]|uniref:Glycosyltransferase RgtA/B/C/D-like domain-containing protein n=1 Tax=Tumidithrix elongata BACA0141 TaxID=2716417 RepID=A0AAW9Q1Y5_9CYAN|nr:hypothetical protein [Tumidithrix elongata RA019]